MYIYRIIVYMYATREFIYYMCMQRDTAVMRVCDEIADICVRLCIT